MLPGIPGQAAGIALSTLRSMMRAPEVKMVFASSFVVLGILWFTIFFRSASRLPEEVRPFLPAGSAAFSLFMLVQFLANQFGFDRDGFRALVLSPAERKLVLLGKNLAVMPMAGLISVALILPLSLWLELGSLTILASLLQLCVMLVMAAFVGNLLSILAPYRVTAGSLKPSKMPVLNVLVMIGCQMLFPLALVPAFLPQIAALFLARSGFAYSALVNFSLSLITAIAALAVYLWLLGPLGRLLHSRETHILAKVTAEVE
jgi:hypothetical protein